ncbi:hypothetical protein FOZ61_007039 [Perkinsus olseni]|uniref:Uncharacterized protein n=1 Tax=Perkinsus olseni TaxID=32597 RepID=A0A7J6LAR0_PEROL|nr:hypothetical protein FOZ61_007039 [Perkinsus olseni]KAF4659711.1 hypothetical protein FOL46_006498 [Perkinsus olseni]
MLEGTDFHARYTLFTCIPDWNSGARQMIMPDMLQEQFVLQSDRSSVHPPRVFSTTRCSLTAAVILVVLEPGSAPGRVDVSLLPSSEKSASIHSGSSDSTPDTQTFLHEDALAGKITGAVCAPKRSYFSCPGTKTDMTRPAFVKGHCFASCKWTSMLCPSTSKCVVYGGEKVCFYPQ